MIPNLYTLSYSKSEAEFMLFFSSSCFSDSSVYSCLRLSDKCSDQQLHEDTSGATGSPQQV